MSDVGTDRRAFLLYVFWLSKNTEGVVGSDTHSWTSVTTFNKKDMVTRSLKGIGSRGA